MTKKATAQKFGQDLMRGEGSKAFKSQSRQSALQKTGNSKPINVSGTLGKSFPSIHPYDEYSPVDGSVSVTGTSIFDPVLCELVYRWFCPKDGKILDPFAGGSVRGIVAAYLGYDYTGVELRQEQVEANQSQLEIISKPIVKQEAHNDDKVTITISSKWANHKFNCCVDYIKSQCRGRCCEGADRILISLLPEEVLIQEAAGYKTHEGLLLANPETGKCPHKQTDGLCAVHGTKLKPFGCIVSPFTLNNSDTLIIRNRYSMMKCHGEGEPAYRVFKASLDLILGEEQSDEICSKLDGGSGDIEATIAKETYNKIKYLDSLKHNMLIIPDAEQKMPLWIIGDSKDIDIIAKGEYDLIFSCPPYYDLEVYSDQQGELSAIPDYKDFIGVYRGIINKCVSMLKDNRFACFVVGDIRDKKGYYRNFVADTIEAFQDAGALLYNDAILITAVGSLPIRVGRAFQSNRKLGKTHQNVLVFYKGDPKNIKAIYGDVECGAIEEDFTGKKAELIKG